MKTGDPIGSWLGRLLAKIIRVSDEDVEFASRLEQSSWSRKYFKITSDPPEVWKSVFFWVLFIAGLALTVYVTTR